MLELAVSLGQQLIARSLENQGKLLSNDRAVARQRHRLDQLEPQRIALMRNGEALVSVGEMRSKVSMARLGFDLMSKARVMVVVAPAADLDAGVMHRRKFRRV